PQLSTGTDQRLEQLDRSGRLGRVQDRLVQADVLEGRDRHHQVEGGRRQVDVHHVEVDDAGGDLVLVHDRVVHVEVVGSDVADLEDLHPTVGLDDLLGERNLDVALAEPGVVVVVPEVGDLAAVPVEAAA